MLAGGINPYQIQKSINSKINLVVNEYGIPINFIVTDGSYVDCKEDIYLIEDTFLALRRWRGISDRYAKTLDAFIASVFVRRILLLF